jgi:beta-glucosidase
MLAHGAAVVANRSAWKHKVGLAVNLVPIFPASEREEDRQAARRLDAYLNRQFLDPALLGAVSRKTVELFGRDWPEWSAGELARIRQSIDFLGINYYLRLVVRDDPAAGIARARGVLEPNCPQTAMGWEIYPQGMLEILQGVKDRYGDVPLYITENGAAYDDVLRPNGDVDDRARIEYLRTHLQAAARAIEAGVDLRGYFLWSLLDNFEWQAGFSKRFGIVYVDYPTQRRFAKASARFYADVIRSRGAALAKV